MTAPDDIETLDLTQAQSFYLQNETATARLGALIAPHLRPGDVIYLSGELGMGKSSLARGLIRTLTNLDQDVPSPTFTLMQSYEAEAFAIHHLDLYRIEAPSEVRELGLDELLADSILVIEWPDRLAHLGFDDRLDISLEQADNTNLPHGPRRGRIATLTPKGNFRGQRQFSGDKRFL